MNDEVSNEEPKKKSRWKKWLIEALVLLAIFIAIQAYVTRNMVSGPAPALVGMSQTGEPLNLADYRGDVVMVHYWATWCPICTFEEDSIQAIHEDWPMLSIAMQSGGADIIEQYQEENKLTWNTIIDEDGRIASQWGVRGTPSTFIIDADGNIRFAEQGYTSPWGLRARLWWAKHF